MLIRSEIGIDSPKIDKLLITVFGHTEEAELVKELREKGLLTLGMVAADDDGEIVGYAAFSPVMILGEDHYWVGLAPLAVEEQYRSKQLGARLVHEGLDCLNEFGYTAVVTLGDPAYYSRFGFVPASRYRIYCKWKESEEAFQIYPLSERVVCDMYGCVDYSEPFNRFGT